MYLPPSSSSSAQTLGNPPKTSGSSVSSCTLPDLGGFSVASWASAGLRQRSSRHRGRQRGVRGGARLPAPIWLGTGPRERRIAPLRSIQEVVPEEFVDDAIVSAIANLDAQAAEH